MEDAATGTQTSASGPALEKLAAGALAPREASRLLTFLDRFEKNVKVNGTTSDARAEWDVLRANVFEANWLLAAKKGIKSALNLIDLDTTFVKTGTRAALAVTVKDQPSTFLNVGDIGKLVDQLEQQLGRKGLFDFNAVLNSTVGALKQALADKILRGATGKDTMEEDAGLEWPKELTADGIQSISGMAITPSGFDDTLEDEAGYGTASLFGAPHIFYPNPNLFDPRHVPFAMAPLGDRHARVYREYEFQSIYTPPHEIVHALQTLISDSQVDGWRHEWEASVACLGLLAHVARRYPFLFVEGLAEETMLAFYGAVEWGHAQVSDAVRAGYREWRDSGGRVDPVGHGDSGDAVHHNPVGTWYCKARISIESFEYQQEEDKCFRFLQEILVAIQKAKAAKAAGEGEPKDDTTPRAEFKDLEEVYLTGKGIGKTSDDWSMDLLPIETIELDA